MTSTNQTNFQKIQEFHNASGLENHQEHQLDIFSEEKTGLIKLRLDLIQEEFNELKEAIQNKDFPEVRDAISDILYVVYGAAASFGINADRDYDLVHKSNMSKFCKTEELAQATVDSYKQKFEAGTSPYDTPTYRLSSDGKYYVVYNMSTGKILKSIDYKPVDLSL